ncbi:hypothetical protein Neosp_001287 [[Neocosmospora] mangrovei]
MDYYKGGRILLSQILIKMYSSLKFTNPSDQSIAISGLEKRLMSAFKTRGGYGIFRAFFERSLLITFDLKSTEYYQLVALRCIIVGKDKPSDSNDAALHYVLVIAASSPGKTQSYVRVGIGVVLKRLISWSSVEDVEVH